MGGVDPKDASEKADRLLFELGIKDNKLDNLLQLPAQQLLDAVNRMPPFLPARPGGITGSDNRLNGLFSGGRRAISAR